MIVYLLIGALVFAVCFLADKGFSKLFRSKKIQKSGRAVRMNRTAASFGIVLTALGIATAIAGTSGGWLYFVLGGIVMAFGLFLLLRYLFFGIYYDENGFLVTGFGKKSAEYPFGSITAQQLYRSGSVLTVELYMVDGRTVLLQSNMTGMYEFLDHAFSGWLTQTGRRREDCAFYDPENSRWFPQAEG